MKNLQGKMEDKAVASFQNQPKKLVLNRTNFDTLADLYGDETDGWIGRAVQLFASRARFGNRSVDCIRIRPVNGS
jgi:hypothetical protein